MNFSELGLCDELSQAVADLGYTAPTPIQEKSIPYVLMGRDILGSAQTGTGKTASFTLPMIEILASGRAKARLPRSLILAPTRELAAQVADSFEKFSTYHKLSMALLIGGVSFADQNAALDKGVDVLIATPGRLLDHFERGKVLLTDVKILVIDEADRMLDMGFIRDIKKILKLLPKNRQNLLFSATYSREVKKLADTILSEPVEVEVAPRNATADRVDQEAFEVRQKSKRSTLSSMISKGKWSQVLVFTRTKHGANRLTTQLNKDGVTALAIHGNKSQSAREKALASFKAHKVRVLVATDIAARGLDIVSLPYVVNFELPNIPEDYVHRIGRTGRAGLSGKAISLVSETESEYLFAIEKLLKKRIPLFQYREDDDNLEIERLSSSPPLHSRSNNRSHPNQSTNSRPPSRKRISQRNKTGRKGNAGSDANQKSRSPTKLQDKTPEPRRWKPRKIRPASMK